eukprot:CAMPEP_0181293536 /NCGR_PEP_ID=MMETSP1101-20121128/3117_1 /TAXON_ID=46948 /ORGANISM="Rhodomonas abbreviata, Strain Caron Lab Isolate" /LENGTH=232 /DNA_ID=CAMNT_0023398129 /DNA_START=138 /DNA_END=836 /DNA_ORIENTATION=-
MHNLEVGYDWSAWECRKLGRTSSDKTDHHHHSTHRVHHGVTFDWKVQTKAFFIDQAPSAVADQQCLEVRVDEESGSISHADVRVGKFHVGVYFSRDMEKSRGHQNNHNHHHHQSLHHRDIQQMKKIRGAPGARLRSRSLFINGNTVVNRPFDHMASHMLEHQLEKTDYYRRRRNSDPMHHSSSKHRAQAYSHSQHESHKDQLRPPKQRGLELALGHGDEGLRRRSSSGSARD